MFVLEGVQTAEWNPRLVTEQEPVTLLLSGPAVLTSGYCREVPALSLIHSSSSVLSFHFHNVLSVTLLQLM